MRIIKCRYLSGQWRKKINVKKKKKRTFGDVLDFAGRRVEEEPFGNFDLLLLAQL